MAPSPIQRCVLAALLAATIFAAGCASDPRYQQGTQWITENEAQKKMLNDMGFPQYNGSL
jgi:hypothetical protein